MKVFMLRNPADHFGCPLREKQTGTVRDAVGQSLVAAGIAMRIDPDPEPEPKPAPIVQTIAKPPEVAVAADPVVAAIPEPPPVAVPQPVVEPVPKPVAAPEAKPQIQQTFPAKPKAYVPPAKAPVLDVRKPKNKET